MIPETRALVQAVAEGETNRTALLIGVACLLVTLACKRWRPQIPGVLVALDAANVAAGLFQGFSVSSSSSRTPVAEAAGARTQLTGMVGAPAIALMLLFFPNSSGTSPIRRWPPSSSRRPSG